MKKTDRKIEKFAKEFFVELEKRGEVKKRTFDSVELCLWKTQVGVVDEIYKRVNICTFNFSVYKHISNDERIRYSAKIILPVTIDVTMRLDYSDTLDDDLVDELLGAVQRNTLTDMVRVYDDFYTMDYTKNSKIISLN